MDLMEVFSPPRLTTEAARQGLRAPPPGEEGWGLTTGWDVFDSGRRFWASLARQRPFLVFLGPECKWFSQLMRVNIERMLLEFVDRMRQKAVFMVTFAMMVVVHQHQSGRRFAYEHPLFASSCRQVRLGLAVRGEMPAGHVHVWLTSLRAGVVEEAHGNTHQ